jgi:endonuclease/exonuclease/phosphatase family metal-dependent hydrolase
MNAHTLLTRSGIARVLLGSLLLTLLAPACSEDRVTGPTGHQSPDWNLGRGAEAVTVMTQNVYVGGYVDRIMDAQDPNQIPLLVAETFQEVLFTNFPERAQAFADEIARTRPHLVGLQEISLIRYQSPGDAVIGGAVPATTVLMDYLDILMASLAARGLDYTVAGVTENFDIEMPMIVSPPPSLAFDDVRLTDYDVVLARGDVGISNVAEENFAAADAFMGIEIKRGYVAVDATIKNKTYRFVNTHLDPDDPDVQRDQADELISFLEHETKPVILLGDLNTQAPHGDAYQQFMEAGYADAWLRNLKKGEGEGLTSPHHHLLMNPDIEFNQRIDLILVRNNNRGTMVLGPVFATVWGDESPDRTASGLWPSDHAAVIAELRIPVLGTKAYDR